MIYVASHASALDVLTRLSAHHSGLSSKRRFVSAKNVSHPLPGSAGGGEGGKRDGKRDGICEAVRAR